MNFNQFIVAMLVIINNDGLDRNDFLLFDAFELYQSGNTPEEAVNELSHTT